jgi:hypothetical protein
LIYIFFKLPRTSPLAYLDLKLAETGRARAYEVSLKTFAEPVLCNDGSGRGGQTRNFDGVLNW